MRIIFICPTFYPDRTVAAIRVTEWAKGLAKSGFEVHVLCRKYVTDEEIRSSDPLPDMIRIHYLAANSIGSIVPTESGRDLVPQPRPLTRIVPRQVAVSLLSNISVPDISIWAWRRQKNQALQIVEELSPDIIISSSPPHSIHWLAGSLAKKTKAKWIADLRDPFTIDSRFKAQRFNFLRRFSLLRFERKIYRNADLILHAIPIHYRWARRSFREQSDKIRLLTNGTPSSMTCSTPGKTEADAIDQREPSLFRIFSSSTPPEDLLREICQAAHALFPERQVRFEFCGNKPDKMKHVFGETLIETKYLGRISHAEAISKTHESDLLVSYLLPHRAIGLGLSSKLFEYLATPHPILHVNPTRSDRLFLKHLPGVVMLSESRKQEVQGVLGNLLQTSSEILRARASKFQKQFSRSNQCKQLDRLIREIATDDKMTSKKNP